MAVNQRRAIMTYNFLSPPIRFKPREFKEFSHILASTTMMSDRASLGQTDSVISYAVGQKLSDVLLYKLQGTLGRCTFCRCTFSVTLDMALNLPLNLQKSTSSVLEFFTDETMPLFDVFFRGYIAGVED